MDMKSWVELARRAGASDLHLEPGLPVALRVHGRLRMGEQVAEARELLGLARAVVGEKDWPAFLARRSWDLSRVYAGVRCRINVLQTARGVGLAVRLLSGFQPTIDKLNLHPDLERLAETEHGLVLLTGPTGCGKSSTMAALVQAINVRSARHIVTIERPIEYTFQPRLSLIRQREVGRDTPSFEQALIDALREDPDVLVVGEMRDTETIRLTLNAAETGHLVLATMHSSSVAEALQRITAAFPAEAQGGVRGQLAECLVAVVTQRLRKLERPDIRVPECEILQANAAARSHIREGGFFKLGSVIETGAREGMWSFARYRRWVEERAAWNLPADEPLPASAPPPPALPGLRAPAAVGPSPVAAPGAHVAVNTLAQPVGLAAAPPPGAPPQVLVLDEADDASIGDIIAQLEKRK